MVRRGLCTLLTGIALALASACASEADGPRTDPDSAAETTRAPAIRRTMGEGEARPGAGQDQPGGVSPPAAGVPAVLVTDPSALAWLEDQGLRVGPVAFGTGDARVSSFAGSPGLAAIRAAIEGDVASVRREDPRAGVGMRHSHRLFDLSWFDSDKTRFELVGVVNRADRAPFSPEHCGETRLIYRLAYASEVAGKAVESRLPMTLNVVFWQDDEGGCDEVARRWIDDEGRTGEALARWLRRSDGPLAESRLGRAQLKSVEVDLQVVRWPAVVHPSLGGHAEYVLRVFRPAGRGLEPAPLENTPDVARLRRDREAREALLAWVRDPARLRELEQGIAVMPEEFAAMQVSSVSPRGFGRLANRPWSQLFDEADLSGLELESGTHVRSPRGLLRRLDGLTCSGCHQTRSVAGFHLVGEPRDPARVLDTVFLATSPHLDGDLERRAAWTLAVARGEAADPARPLSDHERHAGGYGARCGLGDPGLAHWTCADGLTCKRLDDPDFGACLPNHPLAGDPCELGTLRTNRVAHADRVRDVRQTSCGDAVCNTSDVGFPTGMCTEGCDDLEDGEACGAIVNLASFNACLARRQPFTDCIELAAFPVGMRECGAHSRCREDYICAKSPRDPEHGVCIPPYFLFQLRVDGHVM